MKQHVPAILNRKILPATDSKVYYVYMLLDTRFPGPYRYGNYTFEFRPLYCGMGKNKRADTHVKGALRGNISQKSIRIRNIIKETGKPPVVKYLKRNLLQQKAFDLEIKLIGLIGRRSNKTGPLVNITRGGEGIKDITMTSSYRKKLSTARSQFLSSLTDEDYYRFWKNQTKKRLSTYESLSDKEKQQIHLNKCKGLSSYWASCSVEKRLQHSEAITAALLARGEALETLRKSNISKALVKHNRDNPSKVKTRVAKSQVTKDLWTEEQFADFCNAVSLGHANRSDEDKRKSAKKKSKAGKLRAANETQEQKDRRSFALSRAQQSTWDGYTNEEREWRSQSLVAAYAKQSKRKKRRTADKISTSVALVHASRSIAEAERWATRISFTALLKHPTITPRIVKTVWSWYDSYDFENCTQIALRRRVIKYIFAQTGRVPVSTLPGLLDLNKLGKKSAQQLSVERSSNRKNKLANMTVEETTMARSRTSLTLLYKIPEIERCWKTLEQLFERTDFTVISQEQFKQNVLRTVYKRTGFKHNRLVI